MNSKLLEDKQRLIVEKFGRWTANNIWISDDFYTMGKSIQGDEIKLRRILQIVVDIVRRPLNNLRILDLACHEGLYAIEFARHGAEVVGIEGREMNIEKAKFVKDVLALQKLDFFQDDVRNLSRAKYGMFDVVLCLGILYHLDTPDVFAFMERISEVCTDVAIIDTRIAYGPTTPYNYKGTRYWGHIIMEHPPGALPEDKIKNYAASLDNPVSFWLSRTSIYCVLVRLGFTSVYECYIPPEPTKPIDRITIVAIKGSQSKVINSPLMDDYPWESSPENFVAYKVERMYGKVYRMMRLLVPRKVRLFIKNRGFLYTLFKPYRRPDPFMKVRAGS
jgi:methyltransferase family protein